VAGSVPLVPFRPARPGSVGERGGCTARAYSLDVILSPEFLVVAILVALIALVPTRKLQALGWPTSWLRTYWVVFVICGLILGEVPSSARLLVPALLIAGVVPYLAGGLLSRFARRRGR
jgi:hypothetical protein